VQDDVIERARQPVSHVVGRESELSALLTMIEADATSGALLLTGEPGIGKTTLWEAGLDAARGRGLRVLSARPSDAEARLGFAALTDLLHDVSDDVLERLPGPQRHALEVALVRAEPTVSQSEHALALGLLNALRALANDEPLLVAIDDVQWLDSPSADALVFTARRLEDSAVAFLLARRPGSASALERTLERRGMTRIEVGPLSLGATRRLLAERLDWSPPRSVLRRIHDSTLGNPLFLLELGRSLAEHGPLGVSEDIPVPDRVDDLLGTRIEGLRDPVRKVLLALALSGDLQASQLADVAGAAAVDEAMNAGLLLVDGDRVRPSHPLLAAAAKQRSRPRDRRDLHLALAGAVADDDLRALHLALATEHPDAELAATVASAAARAGERGARHEAVKLAEQGLRLTPPGAPERGDRLLTLSECLLAIGERRRAADLLSPELGSLPPGNERGRAYLVMSVAAAASNEDIRRHLERALAESADSSPLRAAVLAELSMNDAVIRVEQLPRAEAWALEALNAARHAEPDLQRHVRYALCWVRALRGRPIDDVVERFHRLSDAAYYVVGSPERVAGQRLVWRGDVGRAREILTRLRSIADEQGEPLSYALQRLHVCELELRVGNAGAAARLLDEWAESADDDLLIWPMYERCRALLAACRGIPAEAEQWAAKAIAGAAATGVRWDELEALRARGIADLLAREPARAVESLRPVWEHIQREGVEDPGTFPVAPDLVEALLELDAYDEAQTVTDRLRELAERQEHPWGLATATRCGALVRLASQADDEEAGAALVQAAVAYEGLGLHFDRARSLLGLGRAQRRLRKWGAARHSLEQAVAAFEEIGSVGWAEKARSELARVGARRPPPPGELTKAERRVAELAVDGLANKEIARDLFVSVKTVESHLSHVYAKLGIRSRAQLARRLSQSG
jgi:DNA-binding CsgD family transcriptional regulator